MIHNEIVDTDAGPLKIEFAYTDIGIRHGIWGIPMMSVRAFTPGGSIYERQIAEVTATGLGDRPPFRSLASIMAIELREKPERWSFVCTLPEAYTA